MGLKNIVESLKVQREEMDKTEVTIETPDKDIVIPATKKQPGVILIDQLMKHLYGLSVGSDREKKFGELHVSTLADLCVRAELLEQIYPKEKKGDPRLRMTFDLGHKIHDLYHDRYLGPMQRLWGTWICVNCKRRGENMVMPLQRKCDGIDPCQWRYKESSKSKVVKVGDHEVRVTGSMDGMVIVTEAWKAGYVKNQVLPLEMKSMNGDKFRTLEAPLEKDVFQVNGYLWLWGGLDQALLWYINKSYQGEPKEFIVEKDERIFKRIEDKIQEYGKLMKLVLEARSRNSPLEEAVPTMDRICKIKTESRARRCWWRKECFKLPCPN